MNRLLLIFLFFATIPLLAGCGAASGANTEATLQAAVAATLASLPTDTPAPTVAPTLAPSATPTMADTLTPVPADTPVSDESNPASEFDNTWRAEQVVEAFRAAGLECEGARPMTRDDFGLAPYLTDNAVRFLIPSICEDCGGRIFAFDSLKDLKAVEAYYVSLGESSAAFFSHTFTRDNVLVQINGELPDDRAHYYEVALSEMPDVTTRAPVVATASPTSTETPVPPTVTPEPATPIPPTWTPVPAPVSTPLPLSTAAPPPPAPACCKTCGANSKACGNSCISLSKQCHQPSGCACEG